MLKSDVTDNYSCWQLINFETGGFERRLVLVFVRPKI